MSIFFTSPERGDLVKVKRDIPITITDHLTNNPGIHRGTRGLVRERTGTRLTVAFDTGLGITEVTVKTGDCELIRKGADEQRFLDFAQIKAAVRTGALIALTLPILWYLAVYWTQTGSLNGIIPAITLSAVESALELPTLILAHPTQTLIWILAGTLATRIALGPPPKKRRGRRPWWRP